MNAEEKKLQNEQQAQEKAAKAEKDAKKKADRKEASRLKKLQTLRSTQMSLPIADIKDGIVLTRDGRYVCILEFAPINFNLRSPREQDYIADAFASLLRVMPNKMQIKVLSRKANVETHIREVRTHMETEENENCRIMQQDTIELIRESARHGITRRFLLSFAYERPAGLRSPTWEQIRESMHQQAGRIARLLSSEPCENVLLHDIGDTNHVLDLLYDCLCRSQAETVPLDIHWRAVNDKFLAEGRAVPGQFLPVQEYIAPNEIDPSHYRFLKVDGKYYAFGYILGNSFNEEYISGWLSNYVSMGAGIDVDLFLSRESKEMIQQSLVYSQRFANVRLEKTDSTNADYEEIRKMAGAGYYLKKGMTEGHEFCYVTVMLTITADSIPELEKLIQSVQSSIIGSNLKMRIIQFTHQEAFESSLPLCKPMKSVTRNGKRNVLSCDLGSIYPFTSYEVNDVGGIILGTNMDNGSPVFVNPFNKNIYESANMALLGSTGKGKTFLSQLILTRLRQQGVKTIAIVPINGTQYRRSCEAVGGEFINFYPGSPHKINLMEIRKVDTTVNDAIQGEDHSSILADKIQRIHTFLYLLHPNMTTVEFHNADTAILQTYRRFGITTDNDSLIDRGDPTRYKKMPILGDLHEELKKNGRENKALIAALAPYVSGSASFFNGQTNVRLDNMSTVFNLSKLTDKMLTIAMYIVSVFVSDALHEDISQRKVVLFDEVWKLIGKAGNDQTASFIFELVKTVRALNAATILTTQDIADFFALDNGSYGKSILNNTKIKYIFGINLEEQADMICNMLSLSQEEKDRIRHYGRGQALLIANRNHIEIGVDASPTEEMIITSDPETLSRLYRESTKVKINERSG